MVRLVPDKKLVAKGLAIIEDAEKDLGPLTRGQRRDLLKDNTDWPSFVCGAVEEKIQETHPAAKVSTI